MHNECLQSSDKIICQIQNKCSSLQNKNSNKLETDGKLKHSISEI